MYSFQPISKENLISNNGRLCKGRLFQSKKDLKWAMHMHALNEHFKITIIRSWRDVMRPDIRTLSVDSNNGWFECSWRIILAVLMVSMHVSDKQVLGLSTNYYHRSCKSTSALLTPKTSWPKCRWNMDYSCCIQKLGRRRIMQRRLCTVLPRNQTECYMFIVIDFNRSIKGLLQKFKQTMC